MRVATFKIIAEGRLAEKRGKVCMAGVKHWLHTSLQSHFPVLSRGVSHGTEQKWAPAYHPGPQPGIVWSELALDTKIETLTQEL